jgi:tetratricopeptide (TPR) repeat protein
MAIALAALMGAGSLWAADWKWELSTERYRQLDVFQRAQYDKAAKLLQQNSFKAAASEFEKFKVQFPDSPALPYVLFLHGYCLHQGKVRNQAIKVYHEVLDYFAGEADAAAAAKYFMGLAHLDNGETRQGLLSMKEMVEEEKYRTHPLACGALARLAENHYRNKEFGLAAKYWKQAYDDFRKTNHTEAANARAALITHYIKTRDAASYDAWIVPPAQRDDAEHRKRVAIAWIEQGHNSIFPWHLGQYEKPDQKERIEAMKACYDYFASAKPWFAKTNDLWNYYTRALSFLCQHYQDKKTRDPVVDEAVALIKQVQDKKDANQRYGWLVDRLREGNDTARARYCIGLITDPPMAAYKESEVLTHEQKWNEAVALLQRVEAMGNEYWKGAAMERRAWIYKDALQKYETAIQIYRQINKAPWTLWQIQECYMRWGKLNDAVTTLSEIENSFPSDAPRAAWHKAHYYSNAKEDKKAIAQARKILKAYKGAPEASQAHQLLEKYGIATGGGVFEDEEK